MGITEEEVITQAACEVDEVLRTSLAEQRLERIFPPESVACPTPRILTKEDCLQLFFTTGVPTSGSLLGVYCWAADLGHARYNCDLPPDTTDFSFMNAYD